MNTTHCYVLRNLSVLLHFLLAPFLCMNICKHDHNKARATVSQTDVTRIGTSGILFTEFIDNKILLLLLLLLLLLTFRRLMSTIVDVPHR